MGENLAWLATRAYPGRKIILWAHNNHLIQDKWMYFASGDTLVTRWTSRLTLENIARSTYLGHEARLFFGPRTYSLAVLSHRGTYSPDIRTENLQQRGNFDTLAVLNPTPLGSVEASLAGHGYRVAFVDLRQSARVPRRTRALDYSQSPPMEMNYHEGYDGFLFLETTVGLNENPPNGWVSPADRRR